MAALDYFNIFQHPEVEREQAGSAALAWVRVKQALYHRGANRTYCLPGQAYR